MALRTRRCTRGLANPGKPRTSCSRWTSPDRLVQLPPKVTPSGAVPRKVTRPPERHGVSTTLVGPHIVAYSTNTWCPRFS